MLMCPVCGRERKGAGAEGERCREGPGLPARSRQRVVERGNQWQENGSHREGAAWVIRHMCEISNTENSLYMLGL